MKNDIREMMVTDIQELVTVTKEHFNESKFNKHNFSSDKSSATLVDMHNNDDCIVYLATREEKIIGYMAAVVFDSPVADYITSTDEAFYVLPEYRNTYAAAELVFEYISWAKNNSADYIMLSNNTYNDTSGVDRFLKKMGFEMTTGLYTYKEDK